MRISIANISSSVSDTELATVVHAIQRQVHEDFNPLWGMDATLRVVDVPRELKPDPELNLSDFVLYVGELDDDPAKIENALGYHSLNESGVPFGFVFVDIAAQIKEAWSTTLSHEVLEAIADPDVNLSVIAPHPDDSSKAVLRDYEVCDPVQADSYKIDGVAVSNFVTPLYFARLPNRVTTRTDYMQTGVKRFGVRPGGYYTYIDLATGEQDQVNGRGAEKRNEAKRAAFARAGVQRRVDRHQSLTLLALGQRHGKNGKAVKLAAPKK